MQGGLQQNQDKMRYSEDLENRALMRFTLRVELDDLCGVEGKVVYASADLHRGIHVGGYGLPWNAVSTTQWH